MTKPESHNAVAGPLEPPVRPSTLVAFLEAVNGRHGELDAWLECNNEAEVRAHVLALVNAERETGSTMNTETHESHGAEQEAGEAVAVPNLDPDGDTSRAGFAAMDAEIGARRMSPWQVWREAVRWSTGQRATHGRP